MSTALKRKRTQEQVRPRKRTATTENGGKVVARGPAVRGDKLNWKEIKVSRHLDDAEGFFGLEELSDVEIIKDEATNGILFKPKASAVVLADDSDDRENEDSWSGFDDENGDVENGHPESNEDRSDKMKHANSVPQHDDTERPNSQTQVDDTESHEIDQLASNSRFDLLEDETNETDLDMTAWRDLDLSSNIVQALSALRFTSPTKIQQAAIPVISSGKDVIGKAVTGSGKTLAFGLPIIETWLNSSIPERKQCLALLLAPTRELAHQISKHLSDVCHHLDASPRITTVTGGLSVLKQQRQLETANIVVGTPGRLWEVISGSNDILERLKLSRFLVVDEADRLLSEGHFQEVEDILDALDRKVVDEEEIDEEETTADLQKSQRQTLVFSATFHKDLQQKLATKQKKQKGKVNDLTSDKQSLEYLMHKLPFQADQKPAFIDANPDSQLAENLTETILECKAMEKDLHLYGYLLHDQQRRKKLKLRMDNMEEVSAARILVFTNSVSAVKRLVPLLQSLQIPSTTISPLQSNMAQKARLRSLERFSGTDGKTKDTDTTVLIATDVAARGLDIKGITTIVHYHVPRTADTYIHRSGRTARQDKSGDSVLLCPPDETASVTKLIAKMHAKTTSAKNVKNIVDRMYLPGDLMRQIHARVDLAQKIVESEQGSQKVKSEDNWLREAADELGVDYDSDEFEKAGQQGKRGRGGGKGKKQKIAAETDQRKGKVVAWKSRLKDELQQRIDFGDEAGRNMKYLAGGAFDVDKLLAERKQQ